LPQAEVVHNLDAASGMASSLALAAHIAAERAVSSLLVTLADMPFVSLETLRVLVAETDPGGISAAGIPVAD
jgi:CTP:molybdopterin cytidylyltransferase MocA